MADESEPSSAPAESLVFASRTLEPLFSPSWLPYAARMTLPFSEARARADDARAAW